MKNKLLIFAVMAVLLLGITTAQAYAPGAFIPGTPINGANTTRCGYVDFTWSANTSQSPLNVTDGYNFTYDPNSNGVFQWSNFTAVATPNATIGIFTTHQNVTAYVYAYNDTLGNLSLTNLSLGYAVANCPINITNCVTSFSWSYSATGSFDLGYTDGDGDVAAFDSNCSFGNFNPTTGLFTWLILNVSDTGTYHWSFNVTESNATITGITPNVDYCNITVTVGMPSSRRGAPALTPIAIIGGIALWSVIISIVLMRRKRRQN